MPARNASVLCPLVMMRAITLYGTCKRVYDRFWQVRTLAGIVARFSSSAPPVSSQFIPDANFRQLRYIFARPPCVRVCRQCSTSVPRSSKGCRATLLHFTNTRRPVFRVFQHCRSSNCRVAPCASPGTCADGKVWMDRDGLRLSDSFQAFMALSQVSTLNCQWYNPGFT